MKQVRLGLIGCGAMGQRHAQAAANSSEMILAAVADPVAERACEVAARHNVGKVYAHGQELIEDDGLDAVVLAMPTSIRSPLALEALRRGRHVMLEKPAALNVAELERMIAARGDRVVACASSRYRFLPSVSVVKDFLQTDPLGPLRSIFIRDFSPAKPATTKPRPAWRLSRGLNGGGIFVNWGCYDLDYVLGLLDWRVKPLQVSAQCWNVPAYLTSQVHQDSDAETHVIAFVRCADATILHYERAEYIPLQTDCRAWEIIGERGSLRLQMQPSETKRIHYDFYDESVGTQSRVIWEGGEDGSVVHSRPVLDFAQAILHGRPPATTLEQALIIQKITDAVYASAATGRQIAIP